MRVGFGYDVHGFDESRPLVIGGVTIPDAPGLAGWSDADIVVHAIVDALLGAAGLGDLGTHFPEDAVPEGSSSLEMLQRAAEMLSQAGLKVVNIDTTIVIQDVRIGPHRAEMSQRISEALGVDASVVSIKATTTDRLGSIGRGEGAAGIAVALVESAPPSGTGLETAPA